MSYNNQNQSFNNELLEQSIRFIENRDNVKIKNKQFVLFNDKSNFDLVLENNQMFFINSISAFALDNGQSMTGTIKNINNDDVIISAPLLFERNSGDEIYQSFLNFSNSLVGGMSNFINVYNLSYSGYILTFDNNIVEPPPSLTIENISNPFANVIYVKIDETIPFNDMTISGKPNIFINIYESDGVTLIKQWGTEESEIGLVVGDGFEGISTIELNSNNGIILPNNIVIEFSKGSIISDTNREIEYSKTPFQLN